MDLMQPFTDKTTVARYGEGPPRQVPGFADLQRMSMVLLAEKAPPAAEILVLGAGGGLELKAFAEAQPSWRFVGVDPSAEMLDLAARMSEPFGSRIQLQQGYIDAAPPGPFDGAACILTLHFIPKEERLRTLREIRSRLEPGAPLVAAHHSCPPGSDLLRWLTRSAAFAGQPGVDFERAANSAATMVERLPILSTGEDEALLREAGFTNVELFYAGFSFRGWVATA
jgi:tRNA (cmo5U34)-methyltransferase